jgi:hypothetical protein
MAMAKVMANYTVTKRPLAIGFKKHKKYFEFFKLANFAHFST